MDDFVFFSTCEDINMAESFDSTNNIGYNIPRGSALGSVGVKPKDDDRVPGNAAAIGSRNGGMDIQELNSLYNHTQNHAAGAATNALRLLQQGEFSQEMHNWRLEQRLSALEMHIWRLEKQLLRQDCVFVRRDEHEDRLSSIDEQVECIRNDIDMFGDRILELENSKTGEDSKGHSNADLAGAKAVLERTMGDGGSEDSV